MLLYQAKSVQQIDKLAQKYLNLSEILLIKKAAYAALKKITKLYPNARKLYVFAGIGNNGSDGLMLAQLAYIANFEVKIYQIKPKNIALCAASQIINRQLKQIGLESTIIDNALSIKHLLKNIFQADLLVDGIFGIGLSRNINGIFKAVIDKINQTKLPVFALDIPSGLDSNSGKTLGVSIKANHTLSFIVHKFGMYTANAKDSCGKIHLNDLNININQLKKILKKQNKIDLIEQIQSQAFAPKFKIVKRLLKKRIENSHKLSFGSSLLIGGNHNMAGAIILSAQGAIKVGSGLTKIISQEKNLIAVLKEQPEVMFYTFNQFDHIFNQANALAIGPGLGQDQWAKNCFEKTINHPLSQKIPLVIDADGLNLLANSSSQKRKNWILTPHPKEAARLLKTSVDIIQTDRLLAIKKLQQKFGGVVVLKGSGSLISDGKQVYLCRYGNSGMACGGMGDVLTGIITGLLAQKLKPIDAALLGTIAHSYFADKCAKKVGKLGLSPSNLINSLRL